MVTHFRQSNVVDSQDQHTQCTSKCNVPYEVPTSCSFHKRTHLPLLTKPSSLPCTRSLTQRFGRCTNRWWERTILMFGWWMGVGSSRSSCIVRPSAGMQQPSGLQPLWPCTQEGRNGSRLRAKHGAHRWAPCRWEFQRAKARGR